MPTEELCTERKVLAEAGVPTQELKVERASGFFPAPKLVFRKHSMST